MDFTCPIANLCESYEKLLEELEEEYKNLKEESNLKEEPMEEDSKNFLEELKIPDDFDYSGPDFIVRNRLKSLSKNNILVKYDGKWYKILLNTNKKILNKLLEESDDSL